MREPTLRGEAMSANRVLLLTDVVDSTKLAEQLGDVFMAGVWLAHDRAARDLLPKWRGREIDKTDGMLLLFDSVADAVQYALAYHQALTTLQEPLKARAGLHVGPVLLRENAAADIARGAKPLEVEGLTKPATARIMSLALGGQTLLSDDARRSLGDESSWRLQSHGHWLLKGLAEPLELFEVGVAETVFALPPDGDKGYRVVRIGERWLPVRQIPNNLPQQVTSFIGRELELQEIKLLLLNSRLLTLLGMGGLGKTRLSLQAAAELIVGYPDGVWFLDFAPLRDPTLVLAEAAQVLGVREEPGRGLLHTLCEALKPKRSLLIFDNCEHLIEATAQLADALLRAAPGLQILASSREALRVPGEQGYPVLPLPLPGRNDRPDEWARSTAVRLFVDRARLHKPGFELGDREAPAVAELVLRLEGIPLALELAAARVRLMSVGDINVRLRDRYKLLTGGARVLLARQQTLRALVDWSYELLNAAEQRVFNRLSVFAGGFDIEAAESVCAPQLHAQDDMLDLVASLVDKSLASMEESGSGTRYRMLETIRDYAREKLDQSGEAAALTTRHCEHYFAFAKAVKRGLSGDEQPLWIQRGEADLDNIRSATATALAGGADPVIAVKLAVAMMAFWILRGYASEGRNVVRAALALPAIQVSDLAQAHASYIGAGLATSQGDHDEATKLLERCLDLHRRLGSPVDIAATLSTLSLARLQAGDAAAAEASEREALELFRSLQQREGEAIGLLHLGQIAVYVGDADAARSNLQGCLRIARVIEHREVEGEAELLLGENAFESQQSDAAHGHLQRSLQICIAAGDRRGEAHALYWLGKLDLHAADVSAARTRIDAAMRTFTAFEMREESIEAYESCAEMMACEGRAAQALRLAAACEQYRQRLSVNRSPAALRRWRAVLERLRSALSEAAYRSAWQAGRAIDPAAALADVEAPRVRPVSVA